jgi:hypothetical protein
MTEALITLARTYIEDETAPYTVSDTIIEQKLNADRRYIEEKQIYSEDYFYDDESLIYKIGYCYLMNLVLTDEDENVIADTNYTVDVENGIITFDAGYTIPDSVYATFNYFDFYNAVAELWLYQAAKSRFDGTAKLGDEGIPEDKGSRSYCIRKYWDYRTSKNIQLER